jgi:hypothetical protein
MDKAELAKYMENPNVKWVLYNILKHESGKVNGKVNTGGFNESAGDSTAYGSGQFIGKTRNTILNDYSIDAWSDSLEDQQLAAIALMHSNGDLDAIAGGDYSGLKSNNYWEAFSSDENHKRLTKNKPAGWEDKYTNMQSDSIHDPAASWSKLSPEMKKEKKGWFDSKYGGMPKGFDIGGGVPTEEQAKEDPRYARNKSPRLDEAKDFIKQWKEIQGSERVDKERALKDLAKTHPGFKYTVPGYVKGKTKGHSGGVNPKNYTVGHIEKNVNLLTYHRLSDIDKWINNSEAAILKQADAADQISVGVKPSLVLKGVDDNISIAKDEKNNIPATDASKSPTPVLTEDNKVENFVELPEMDESALVDPIVDEDADVEDDFEIEEIDLSLAPELEKDEDLSFEDWKIRYPDGTQEEYDNRGVTEGDSGYQDWLKDNPGGTKEEYQKYFDLRGDTSGLGEESFLDKIGGLSSLIGLATGAMGLGQALKDVDIPKDPKLGPAFQQRLEESKRLAQQGLTPSELAKAHNDLDSSYATGIENIVRGSAGNRAQFLAGLGGLDVARQSALMDIAVADASMQRQNQDKYDKMMMVNEQYEAARTSKYDQAKYEQDMATKSAGAALAGSALSMVNENIGNRQLNRYNKMKTEKLMRDMGYRNDSNGKSTEKQLGVDPDTGEKVQTSFSLPGDDNYVVPNLLSADEQVINTEVENNQASLIDDSSLNETNLLPFDAFDLSRRKSKPSGLINPDNILFEY